MAITGSTRIFAIVADPIAHVKTPEILNLRLARSGLDGVLVPLHVTPADLPAAFAAFRGFGNFGGCVVTVPHKVAALALCDEASEAARGIGAVNCIRREDDGRLVGAMLDGIGFVDGLRAGGIDPRGASVFLAGAGGAASAIAFALCDAGVSRLTVANRDTGKRDDLVARLARLHPGCTVTGEGRARAADILINATSLGLSPDDPPPIDPAEIETRHVVAEIVMEPAMTPLLLAAEKKGCRIHLGRHMLEAQAAAMIAHMTAGASR